MARLKSITKKIKAVQPFCFRKTAGLHKGWNEIREVGMGWGAVCLKA
jgi:hypothetical protein